MPGGFPIAHIGPTKPPGDGAPDALREAALQYLSWDRDPSKLCFIGWVSALFVLAAFWEWWPR